MRGSKKKTTLKRALRKKRLLILLSLLVVIAAASFVGWKVYPPFKSQASDNSKPFQLTWGVKYAHSNTTHQRPGDNVTVSILLTTGGFGKEPVTYPAFQAVSVFAYDTKYYKLINGNCVWRYGCRISTIDTVNPPYASEANENGMHKKRIAICFDIPANTQCHSC